MSKLPITEEDEEKKKIFPFHEMGLDDRILKAIAKLGWVNPTLIQERAIPLIIEGKDVLARGRTGSGKTGAFCIPLIQRILEVKTSSSGNVLQVAIQAPKYCIIDMGWVGWVWIALCGLHFLSYTLSLMSCVVCRL